MSKPRLLGLDLFRVLSVLMIFLFHSRMHMGCDYGVLDPFVSMGAIFMTAFFLLSGYVIRYTSDKYLERGVMPYYKKRILGIIPAYWAIGILFTLYAVAGFYMMKPERLHDFVTTSVFLFPIETLGLQSAFSTLFPYSHNSGTWFVSCLLICYLVYPLLRQIEGELSLKGKIFLILALVGVLFYVPFVPYICNTADIYTNILFRVLEFFIGVLLASLTLPERVKPFICSWWAFVAEVFILIIGVSVAKLIGIPSDYMLYSWCALPCFIVITLTLSGIGSNKILESRAMAYLVSISYMFFFAQFFLWDPLSIGLGKLGIADNNKIKIIVSLIFCLLIAIILHELVEKPSQNLVNKFLNNPVKKAND